MRGNNYYDYWIQFDFLSFISESQKKCTLKGVNWYVNGYVNGVGDLVFALPRRRGKRIALGRGLPGCGVVEGNYVPGTL